MKSKLRRRLLLARILRDAGERGSTLHAVPGNQGRNRGGAAAAAAAAAWGSRNMLSQAKSGGDSPSWVSIFHVDIIS
jgi:hypothetical protein